MDKRELAKKALEKVSEQIPIESKHVRYNYEESTENFHMDTPLTKYYFAIVDKRKTYRNETVGKIVDELSRASSYVIPVEPKFEMKVKKGKWGGLSFVTFDVLISSKDVRFSKFGKVRRDQRICRKEALSIEDYLKTVYQPAND